MFKDGKWKNYGLSSAYSREISLALKYCWDKSFNYCTNQRISQTSNYLNLTKLTLIFQIFSVAKLFAKKTDLILSLIIGGH